MNEQMGGIAKGMACVFSISDVSVRDEKLDRAPAVSVFDANKTTLRIYSLTTTSKTIHVYKYIREYIYTYMYI